MRKRRLVVSLGCCWVLTAVISTVPGCSSNTAGTAGIVTEQGKAEANKASADFYKQNHLEKRTKR